MSVWSEVSFSTRSSPVTVTVVEAPPTCNLMMGVTATEERTGTSAVKGEKPARVRSEVIGVEGQIGETILARRVRLGSPREPADRVFDGDGRAGYHRTRSIGNRSCDGAGGRLGLKMDRWRLAEEMGKKQRRNVWETSTYTDPRGILSCLLKLLLGESNVNGRGSGIERKIQESACERRLQIDDWRRHLSRRERHGHRRCWRNDYVRGCTKSATGVRHVCSGMNVRNLNRRAENQQ